MLEATLPLSPCLTSTLQLAVVMEPDFAASASYRGCSEQIRAAWSIRGIVELHIHAMVLLT